jgi:MFS transporter, DHA3 family, macrolide efflux protein
MFKLMLGLFKNNIWYLTMTVGMLLSALGTQLTQMAVYWHLGTSHSPALTYGVAFAASIVPGIIASHFGEFLARRFGAFKIMIVSEVAGAIGLLIPWIGLILNSTPIFTVSTFLPAFFGALSLAAISGIMKAGFSDAEYPALGAVDTLMFATTMIAGVGVGALLTALVSMKIFLIIDFATYLVSIFALLVSKHMYRGSVVADGGNARRARLNMDGEQMRALLLIPLLSLVSGAAMALLPAFGTSTSNLDIGSISITGTVAFLVARGLGQLVGPFLLPPELVGKLFSSSRWIGALTFLFVFCYSLVFMGSLGIWLELALVVIAHIGSNIIFVAAQAAVYRSFSEDDISVAMVRSYQLQVLLTGMVAIAASACADKVSITASFFIFSFPSFILFVILLLRIPSKEASFRVEA